ncbi:hypothetical protein RRSWK_06367 [Rhodopirellula sp. SWK7]|nr:hypothetical protein RRSWK_06367 [Rhodopirellula sp. SWK7]
MPTRLIAELIQCHAMSWRPHLRGLWGRRSVAFDSSEALDDMGESREGDVIPTIPF